ncbi:MAG: prepilin-type N-terminal cleavage/methylation domain-containing protein [Fimbriimonadaceae bacterium]
MGARRGFTFIEALVSIALAGIGIASVVGAMGAMTKTEANAIEKEKMQRLAVDKYEELVATNDYDSVTTGDFEDRGEPDFAWSAEVQTTGVEGLDQLQLTVRRSTGREAEISITGLVYAPTQSTTTGGGTP